MPNLAINDVEEMSLVEIEKRIDFVGNLKKEKRKIEMKDMFGMLHFTIKSATIQAGKKTHAIANNKAFYKTLDDCFSLEEDKKDNEDIDDLGDFMEVMNVKK